MHTHKDTCMHTDKALQSVKVKIVHTCTNVCTHTHMYTHKRSTFCHRKIVTAAVGWYINTYIPSSCIHEKIVCVSQHKIITAAVGWYVHKNIHCVYLYIYILRICIHTKIHLQSTQGYHSSCPSVYVDG